MSITVVQHTSTDLGGAAPGTTMAVSFGTLPSTGNAVILSISLSLNGSPTTISGVADNQSGNTYTQIGTATGTGNGITAHYWCPSITAPSGTFTVTATMNATGNSTGQLLGLIEVNGLVGTVDQYSSNYGNSNTGLTQTNGSVNTNAIDLVLFTMGIMNYSGSNYGLANPPTTGYTTWFWEDANTGASTGRAFAAGYKIVTSIETSAGTETWTAAGNPQWNASVASLTGASLPANSAYIAWVT